MFFHFLYALTGDLSETFSISYLMEKFNGGILIAEGKFQPPRFFPVKNSEFITFHYEGRSGSYSYCVKTVCIAVKISFQDMDRIKYPAICSKSTDSLIFRTIHYDFFSFVWSCGKGKSVYCFCTLDAASVPAAIWNTLGKGLFPYFPLDLVVFGT